MTKPRHATTEPRHAMTEPCHAMAKPCRTRPTPVVAVVVSNLGSVPVNYLYRGQKAALSPIFVLTDVTLDFHVYAQLLLVTQLGQSLPLWICLDDSLPSLWIGFWIIMSPWSVPR